MAESILNERQNIKTLADRLQQEGKLPLIEIHILRPTGGEMYNRGFNGRHKTLVVGGVERYRFSSQSAKHPIRLKFESEEESHTRVFPQIVKGKLDKKLENNPDAKQKANEILEKLFGDTVKGSGSLGILTKQIHAVCENDSDAFVNAILKAVNVPSGGKTAEEAKNIRTELENGADERALGDSIALFGRMSTDPALSTVYSAVQMNHAYSVNPAAGDYDDFTAMDDYLAMMGVVLDDEGDEKKAVQTGSAHMSTTDIGSNVYYQYASVSERILFENLCRGRRLNEESVKEILDRAKKLVVKFVKEFVFSTPSAKQNSMATYPTPVVAYITVGNNVYPMTMDACFEKAIIGTETNSVAKQAVKRLLKAIEDAKSGGFAVNEYTAQYWISCDDTETPDFLEQKLLKDVLIDLEK